MVQLTFSIISCSCCSQTRGEPKNARSVKTYNSISFLFIYFYFVLLFGFVFSLLFFFVFFFFLLFYSFAIFSLCIYVFIFVSRNKHNRTAAQGVHIFSNHMWCQITQKRRHPMKFPNAPRNAWNFC